MDKKKKQTQSKGKKRGAKSKYETHVKPYLHLIPSWRRDGMTEDLIAKKLGISHNSMARYKKEYNEFWEVIKKGKEEIYAQVQGALYKSTNGYFVIEEVEELEYGGEELDIIIAKKIKKTKRWIPANVTAQIFALKNQNPAMWRNDTDKKIVSNKKRLTLIDDLKEKGDKNEVK